MEVLIELIVSVLRGLFGDAEKPADVSQPTLRGSTKPVRGPYNYGDEPESGAASSSRPKTLEEILEEVRERAAQKRQSADHPAARSPNPPPIPKPARRTLVAVPPQDAKPVERKWAVQQEEAPAPRVGLPAPELQTSFAPATTKGAALPSEARTAKAQAAARSPEKIQPRKQAAAPQPKRAKMAAQQQAASPAQADSRFDFVHILRAAPPAAKRAAARQAVILSEVFGPPRSRKPLTPGNMRSPLKK
jgi:hypothetical protein